MRLQTCSCSSTNNLPSNCCRSEDVSGHVTALAINSVNKFLSYDLIDCGKSGVKIAVENLADAVTHARFVGTDSSSDEVVLMKIIGKFFSFYFKKLN